MNSRNKPALTLCIVLKLAYIATGSIITEVTKLSKEDWSKNEECCTATSPEDFKYCVTHRRHALPAPYLGFKSISCQCHSPLSTSGDRIQNKRVQTFRQCFFTEEENKEEQPADTDMIFRACIEGKLATVKHIVLNKPEKIYSKSSNERTPAMVAALNGRKDVFNFLACHTCRWNDTDKYNNSVLHLACIGGSLSIVTWVLRFVDIDSKGEDQTTAVLLAIRYGYMSIAEMLIREGCNLTVVDYLQNNLLHLACKSNSMKALRYVFTMGIYSLESRNSDGLTPLLMAVELRFLEGCKYLIEQGADVTAVDKYSDSILHHVLLGKKRKTVRIAMMKYLLSNDYVNKDGQGRYKQTPLLLAALKGDLDVFKLLVKEGCNTNIVDEDGDNILHLASLGGDYATVNYILDKAFISPMARDSLGRTALMRASHYESIGVFKLLQRRGCNMAMLDYRGNSVLHAACCGGYVKMIKYILSRNTLETDAKGAHGLTPLMYTVRYGKVEALKLMLSKRCSTKNKDDEGNTILHLACISGNMDMVKLLIHLNLAQHYNKERNYEDQTAKQLAEAKGFDEIVNILRDL